jgi:hypothetical protein
VHLRVRRRRRPFLRWIDPWKCMYQSIIYTI